MRNARTKTTRVLVFSTGVGLAASSVVAAACDDASSSSPPLTLPTLDGGSFSAPEAGAFDAARSDAASSGDAGTDSAGIDGGNVAIVVPGLGSGFDYHQGSYSLGWTFTANAAIHVTALGFYDDLANGLTESHPVGIFDKTSKAMLASTTVSPSDPLDGYFRYAALATPLTLTQGTQYVVLAVVGSEKYIAYQAIDPTWTVAPSLTYTGAAVNYANAQATTLLFPDTFGPTGGDLGPNFKFAPP